MVLSRQNKYGEQFVATIKAFLEEYPETDHSKQNNAEVAGNFVEFKSLLLINGMEKGYQPWSNEEEQRLREEFHEGLTVKQISNIHQRTHGAIKSRLKKLGLQIENAD